MDWCDLDSEARLIEVIAKHKISFIDDAKKINIKQFLESFDNSYNMTEFLNNFDEYCAEEQQNPSYVENVYQKVILKLNGNKCEVSNCKSIARNGRDKQMCKNNDNFRVSLYGNNNTTDEEISYHQILDSIHVYVMHSFDMGCRLRQTEREKLYENKTDESKDEYHEHNDTALTQFIRQKSERFQQNYQHNDKRKNKFITVIPDPQKQSTSFRENLLNEVNSQYKSQYKSHTIKTSLLTLKQWWEREEFDTDAICIDIDEDYSSNT
eukprot:13063_1